MAYHAVATSVARLPVVGCSPRRTPIVLQETSCGAPNQKQVIERLRPSLSETRCSKPFPRYYRRSPRSHCNSGSTTPHTVARGLSVNSASTDTSRTGQIPDLASPFLTSGRVDCHPSVATTVSRDGRTAIQRFSHRRNPRSALHRTTHTRTPPVAPDSLRSCDHIRGTADSCSSDLQTQR